MGNFPRIAPGQDARVLLGNAHWLNGLTGLLDSVNFKLGRRVNHGGGGSFRNLTTFALVTVQAIANGGGVGKAVLLSDETGTLEPVDADGDPLILDPEDPEYDAEVVEEAEIAFKSAHTDAACKVGERVQLFGRRIAPGEEWDDAKVWGVHVDGSGYWQGHGSFANNYYLGAADGEALYREFETDTWDGSVTGDAACDDGNIVITVEPTGGGFEFVVPPT